MSWQPALQSLRGVAALWVVFYHIEVHRLALGLPLTGIPGMRFGWLGVDLFFVLSGFLLAPAFFGTGRPVRGFYVDRFVRIAPAYYAAFLAALVLVWVRFRPLDWTGILWNALFQTNWDLGTYVALNPVFWTLAVEMQFYLVLPLLARAFTRRHWPLALLACIAASIAWRAWTFDGEPPLGLFASVFWFPAFLGHFAVGIAAARLRSTWRPAWLTVLGLLLVAVPTVVLIPAGSIEFGFDDLRGHLIVRPLAALGFGLIVMASVVDGPVRTWLSVAPLQFLGGMSYSLYLIHLVVLYTVDAFIDIRSHPWWFATAVVIASLIAGYLLWRLVEDPVQRWRHLRRRQRIAAP